MILCVSLLLPLPACELPSLAGRRRRTTQPLCRSLFAVAWLQLHCPGLQVASGVRLGRADPVRPGTRPSDTGTVSRAPSQEPCEARHRGILVSPGSSLQARANQHHKPEPYPNATGGSRPQEQLREPHLVFEQPCPACLAQNLCTLPKAGLQRPALGLVASPGVARSACPGYAELPCRVLPAPQVASSLEGVKKR